MSSITVNPSMTVRRPAAPRAAASSTPLRLTRRGRLVVTAVLLLLVLTTLTVFGARSAATDQTGSPVRTRTVEVAEGDTLWGIASSVSEPGGTRAMVLRIQELNALSTASIAEGQKIAVPLE